MRALLIEDDVDFRESLALLVQREGFESHGVGSLERAREALAEGGWDVVLVDLELPDGRGTELLDDEVTGGAEVIVVTGHASVESAVAALREGAADYLTKPVDRARLKSVLAGVVRTRGLRAELSGLRQELLELGRFGPMVGRSKPMREVYELLARVAPTEVTVLIVGDSGTGKELAAQTVHGLSSRKNEIFLPVNCGAISPTLIESEIFGHEKGAFTGADRRHAGFFERAEGGTLFLDEITEMPLELQVNLLRVLETGSLLRVGGREPVQVDVRLIAATNRNPREAVATGLLREDLYYRLNVFPVALPRLRDRGDDLVLLTEHFLEQLNREQEPPKRCSARALARLREHDWPGNVRELKNALQRAFILADEEIGPESLPLESAGSSPGPEPEKGGELKLQVRPGTPIAEAERRLILATLDHFDGDKKRAASALGISLKTLYNRLNVYEAAGSDRDS